jgi:hypothetical protein
LETIIEFVLSPFFRYPMPLQPEMVDSDGTIRGTMSKVDAGEGGQLDPADCVILREGKRKRMKWKDKSGGKT